MSDQAQQQAPPQPEGGAGGWFPPGPPPIIFETFRGLNTEASRPGIRDDEMSWCDSFFPIGPNNLRTLWGAGAGVFPAQGGTNWTQFWFGVIGPETTPQDIPFVMPVLFAVGADSSVWACKFPGTGSSTIVNVLPAGYLANPGIGHVGFSQWSRNFILIVGDGTGSHYWAWDGVTLYTPGAAVPGFANMPTGINGTAIEVYQNRVWILNGANSVFSAPGDFTTFATSSGGGAFQINDGQLRYTGVRYLSVNGFLYMIGDSEIDYISNVQTSGIPPTTTFSIQNADPDTGTPFPAAVDAFGPTIIFANPWGVQQSAGGAARKISDALDGIYNSGPADVLAPIFVSPGWNPSSAKAIIFGKKVWMVLMPIITPTVPTTPYCAIPIEDDSPVFGATADALANTPASFTTGLFSVWLNLPDPATNAGIIFSNQDNDQGSPNPGVQIAITNDASDPTAQVWINLYDSIGNPIVQSRYPWTNWAGWVHFIISIDVTTRTLTVIANQSGTTPPSTTPLTPTGIIWTSSNAMVNPSGHSWHFMPEVF